VPWRKVKKGEWIGGIVAKAGHKSWKEVWNHSRNARLRKKRDPNLLVKGDFLYIPKVESKEESESSDTRYRHKVEREQDELILCFKEVGAYIKLFGAIAYKIKVGKNELEGEIKSEGQKVKIPLGLAVEEGALWIEGVEYKLDIGGLDPVWRLSGVQARINNLGWDTGKVDNIMGPLTRRGVRDFEAYYKIKVDGKVDSTTRNKVKEVYGC
jgi:hypothetical protein